MPVSRSEFESGKFELNGLLAEFLHSNADYAYTAEELVQKLASGNVNVTVEEVRNALELLAGRGRVERKTISGMVYYGILCL